MLKPQRQQHQKQQHHDKRLLQRFVDFGPPANEVALWQSWSCSRTATDLMMSHAGVRHVAGFNLGRGIGLIETSKI